MPPRGGSPSVVYENGRPATTCASFSRAEYNIEILEEARPVADIISDAELIATAKELNASAQSFLRMSVEELWKLGEALTRLQERPSVKGRWRQVLGEIGINHTSANHAQRLHAATSFKKLSGYRNKTAALRALGILSEPTSASKEPTPASRETTDRATKPTVGSDRKAQVAAESQDEVPVGVAGEVRMATPVTDPERARTGGQVAEMEEVEGRPEPAPIEMILDPLTKLTKIATSLEYIVEEEFDLTAEFIAQIDRATKALDLLRRKGADRVAA